MEEVFDASAGFTPPTVDDFPTANVDLYTARAGSYPTGAAKDIDTAGADTYPGSADTDTAGAVGTTVDAEEGPIPDIPAVYKASFTQGIWEGLTAARRLHFIEPIGVAKSFLTRQLFQTKNACASKLRRQGRPRQQPQTVLQGLRKHVKEETITQSSVDLTPNSNLPQTNAKHLPGNVI